MRRVIDPQMVFGHVDISAIVLDPKSRDDVPQLLRGLQHIYGDPDLRARVFAILSDVLPAGLGANGKADPNNGRPGMAQWAILVLGVMRLGLNADYDRIQELANQHITLRLMMGLGGWTDKTHFEVQTLKDNLRLFTPDILERINQEVVKAGHAALKKNADLGLNVRCDSFVVETNVHYPTDINLLFDAMRKTLQICAKLSDTCAITLWRQSAYHVRQIKASYRHVQKLKHSTSKDESAREKQRMLVVGAHQAYIELAESYLLRVGATRELLVIKLAAGGLRQLDCFIDHARRQIDQIHRRVVLGEEISHAEKVFSVFQTHSEWICKGKAGTPQEIGLRVCVVEDEDRFILHHHVMEKTTDDQVAVAMAAAVKRSFPTVTAMSFDKGFHSPDNQVALATMIDRVVLPKKGRRSAAERIRESDPEFVHLRRQHSAVESAINALECHGLDRCPDHGIDGFKRYVALAVLARNIQRLGVVVKHQAQKRWRGPYQKAA